MKIQHRVTTLRNIINLRDQINLRPAWQRGPVWGESKKALLIDSILRGYDVPMIYLSEQPKNAAYSYEVVDGQQRLRSIWDFIDGVVCLPDAAPKVDGLVIAGREYADLSKRLVAKFKQFKIVVAYVRNAREPEISILFSRMQMGVRLNPAELRNAIQSNLRNAIDGVARTHPFFNKSRISEARFKRQDYLAHAISVCIHSASRDVKAPQLKNDYETLNDPTTHTHVIADAITVLDFLERVNERVDQRVTQKWMFVDLFYLSYVNRNRLLDSKVKIFADTYTKFESERVENNAEPEDLLAGSPSSEQKDLYDYIMAFKYSGAEKQSIQERNRVLTKRFTKVFR